MQSLFLGRSKSTVTTTCASGCATLFPMTLTEIMTMAEAWDPQAVKLAIDLELDFHNDTTDASAAMVRLGSEALARNKAREAAPVAMAAIVHLATYAENESLRFKAAAYIVDRVLGRVTDVPMDASSIDDEDPLTKLVKAAVVNQQVN